MGFISSEALDALGLGYSIVGIALVAPICFGFRQYFRFLDHLQIFYLLFLGLASSSKIFSGQLDESWVLFPRNFYIFCNSGDFVCSVGFPLSFMSCLLVFLVIVRIIVAIETCRNSQIRFEPVYTFFKGFFRWSYLPLTYYSLYFMIKSIQGTKDSLISSIVVLAFCLLFPVIQLIAYKCIQKEDEDIWRKWIEFFSYLRLILVAVLVVCADLMQSTAPYYFIYGIYVLYAVIYAWKNKFVFPVGGRIIFILGELCAMTVSFFFIFQKALMVDYYLDLFFISGILLLDVCYYIAMTVYLIKYGMPKDTASEKVHPGSDESQG